MPKSVSNRLENQFQCGTSTKNLKKLWEKFFKFRAPIRIILKYLQIVYLSRHISTVHNLITFLRFFHYSCFNKNNVTLTTFQRGFAVYARRREIFRNIIAPAYQEEKAEKGKPAQSISRYAEWLPAASSRTSLVQGTQNPEGIHISQPLSSLSFKTPPYGILSS